MAEAGYPGLPRSAGGERDTRSPLRPLASLRLTLALIAMLAAGTFIALQYEDARTWPMVVPLGLLATNLLGRTCWLR